MAIINHNSISGVTTVSVGSSIVVGDTFVITSNGLENITQISATGVITATSFSGALTGNVTGSATALSGTPDVTVGTLNATDAIISGDLTVQGTTTTLDTVVTEVDKLEVDANNTTVGVAITQSGTGDILRLYDGATQVVTVTDGGKVVAGSNGVGYPARLQSHGAGNVLDLNSTSGAAVIRFYESGSGRFDLRTNNGSSGLNFYDSLNGVERLRVDSGGRIGIGTEDPTAGTDGESDDLVIHRASGAAGMTIKTAANATGAIRFADPDGASQGRIEYNHPSDYLRWNTGGSEKLRIDSSGNLSLAADTDTYISHPASDTLALTTGGTERLRITSSGQLNINASSESIGGKVIIKNNVDYTATEFDDDPTLYLLNGDQTTGISEASIVFAGRNTGGSTYRAAISGNGSTGLKFYPTSNVDQNDDPAMIIRGSGNVGIGTDIPAGKFQVFNTQVSNSVTIDTAGRILIGRTTNLQSSSEKLTLDSGMVIFRNNSTTTAPLYLRNDDSTADTRHPYLIFADGSGNRGGIGVQNDNSSLWISGQTGIRFRGGTSSPGNTEWMRISSSGDVGIGDDSPSCRLQVKDTATHTAYASQTPSVGDCTLSLVNRPSSEAINNHATIQFNVTGGTYNRVCSISAVAESASNRYAALTFCTDDAGSRTEKLRIGSAGQFGIGGANYGTSGQVLTSQGSSAAPQWADAAGGYTWTSAVTMTGNNVLEITGIPDGTTQIFVSVEECSWITSHNNAMQFNVGTSSIDTTNSYTWGISYSGTGISQATSATSYFRCCPATYQSGTNKMGGFILITKTASSSWVLSSTLNELANGNPVANSSGRYFGADEINKVRFTCNSGNYDSGRFRVGYA